VSIWSTFTWCFHSHFPVVFGPPAGRKGRKSRHIPVMRVIVTDADREVAQGVADADDQLQALSEDARSGCPTTTSHSCASGHSRATAVTNLTSR